MFPGKQWNGLCAPSRRISHHGATDGRTEAQLVGSKEEWPEVRKVRIEESGKRDAPPQEGNAQERERPQGEEPEAGDCDRTLGGAREGRKGPAEARREEVEPEKIQQSEEVQQPEIQQSEEVRRPEEIEQLEDDVQHHRPAAILRPGRGARCVSDRR